MIGPSGDRTAIADPPPLVMPPLEFRNLRIDFGTQIRGSLAQHRPGSDTDAEARCRLEMPVLRDLGDGRRVACHREE